MPLTDILILLGIIAAFAIFGLVFAWAEYQTRHLPRVHMEVKPQVPTAPDDMRLAA